MSTAMTQSHNGYGHRVNGGLEMSPDDGVIGREMAIDVPANFVPQPKGKPRLSNSLSKEGKEQMKLKKYQDELKSRKEQEKRIQREQDFLRASLRESKKLQNLEKRGAAGEGSSNNLAGDGFVNRAFDRDGDELAKPVGAMGGSLEAPSSQTAAASKKAKDIEAPTVDIGDTVSMEQISSLLVALRGKLGSGSNELRVMNQLFNNVQFQDAVSLYNQVSEAKTASARPVSTYDRMPPQVYEAIKHGDSAEARKLKELLSKAPFKGVVLDDRLLTETPELPSPAQVDISVAKANQYGDGSIRIVTINKTTDPLGATVKNDGEAVVIARIVKGGEADRSKVLHAGDELLEVNDIPLRGKTINEVSEMLANLTGQLQFVVIPYELAGDREQSIDTDRLVSVRALFSYDPEEDQYIACEELGISFQTSDILHIIDQNDPNYWQAYREGEEDQTLAGLIPSRTFWESREQIRLRILAESREAENQSTCCPVGKKKRKTQYNADEIDNEEILTYEEVTKYYPQPNRKRPVVLIGPPEVGRKQLRQRLLELDPDRFAAAIPHTSRPRREGEEDGKDYYFTAKHIFEADIRANKFVEHGPYRKDYYGTSFESIRNVVHSGKICLLNLHPQSLKTLRASDVKPYVVFIAAPGLEKLRMNILKATGNEVSVEHCKNIIDRGREMETKYGHYFDFVISNGDIETAFSELLEEINRLEVEPQWVPSDWLK